MSNNSTHEEQLFARSLVNPEKSIRDKTIKELKKYLSSLNDIDDLDMLKLWKALFYCLWLADKSNIHIELSNTLADLMDSFTNQSLIFNKYLRMFFQIILREWHHLDQYRLNKFYTLIRHMLRKSFNILYKLNWPSHLTEIFCNILSEEVLEKYPNGPRYHICDIYLPELFIATAAGDINTTNFMAIIQPFFKYLGVATDSIFYNRLIDRIFMDYVNIYAREHRQETPCLIPENGHTLMQHEVINGHLSLHQSPTDALAGTGAAGSVEEAICFKHVSSVQIQMMLFEIASSDPTVIPIICTPGHRKRVYTLHAHFQNLTKIQFADAESIERDVNAIPRAPSDLKLNSINNVGKKEKKSKKKNKEIQETIPTPVESVEVEVTREVEEESKLQKKLKKKEKKTKIEQVPETPLVTPAAAAAPVAAPVAVAATPVVATPPPPPPAPTTPPPDYFPSKTFTGAKVGYVFKKGPKGVGYYKDLYSTSSSKRASSSSSTPSSSSSSSSSSQSQSQGGDKRQAKRKIEETESTTASIPQGGKTKKIKEKEGRVRFGKNQSKDYIASIQGLKTAVTPPQTIQPTKSAIKETGTPPRPKAASYF